MSNIVDSPYIATNLADALATLQKDRAVCLDFAQELASELAQMNVGLPLQVLNVAFNPNGYDGHTLVEMLNPDSGQWMLLDPTFDLTVRRQSDGGWATAEDMSAATRSMQWSAVTYVFLGAAGDYFARNYYLDYPLLYVNVYHATASIIPPPGTVLPYLQTIATPIVGGWTVYVAGCSAPGSAVLTVNGGDKSFDCSGADNTSQVFGANSVSTSSLSPTVTVYRPQRYLY
jgi:hypothetical protein